MFRRAARPARVAAELGAALENGERPGRPGVPAASRVLASEERILVPGRTRVPWSAQAARAPNPSKRLESHKPSGPTCFRVIASGAIRWTFVPDGIESTPLPMRRLSGSVRIS